MSDTDTLPLYPTNAPAIFQDAEATASMFLPTLAQLASLATIDASRLDDPTPCGGFTVGALQRHALAWLQFFAAALGDPSGTRSRLDPETWQLGPKDDPAGIVERASDEIAQAIRAGAAHTTVVMVQARMAGDGVLAMALGEYLVHAWDLAVATGRAHVPDDRAAAPALEFLQTMIAPEHRGPDSGMFDHEIEPRTGASAFERLLCFTGRSPGWAPPRA